MGERKFFERDVIRVREDGPMTLIYRVAFSAAQQVAIRLPKA